MIYDKRICTRCGKPNGNEFWYLCDKCEGTQFVHDLTSRLINSARAVEEEEEEKKMKVEENKMKQVQVDGKIYDMIFRKESSEHPRRKIAGYIFEPEPETREQAIERLTIALPNAFGNDTLRKCIADAMDWQKNHGEKS